MQTYCQANWTLNICVDNFTSRFTGTIKFSSLNLWPSSTVGPEQVTMTTQHPHLTAVRYSMLTGWLTPLHTCS